MISNSGSRIVRSQPGPGTAETIFITEDGSRWHYNPGITPVIDSQSTAPTNRVGEIVNDRIVVIG